MGDNGDLGKYVAFKALAGDDSAGVVWYAQPDSAGPSASHGSRRTYQGSTKRATSLQALDNGVTAELTRLSHTNRRMRASARRVALWPRETSYPRDHYLTELEPNWRMRWFGAALRQIGGRALVLFDPDNGLAPPDRVTGVHATAEEVFQFVAGGSSLVIVQYAGRTPDALVNKRDALAAELGRERHRPAPFALRWLSDGPSGFLVVPASREARIELSRRAGGLARSHPEFFAEA